MGEPRRIIKVNAAGSWANLLTCHEVDVEAVLTECQKLALLSLGSLLFTVIDPETGDSEIFGKDRKGGLVKRASRTASHLPHLPVDFEHNDFP